MFKADSLISFSCIFGTFHSFGLHKWKISIEFTATIQMKLRDQPEAVIIKLAPTFNSCEKLVF